jgi:hypothetical protein
MIDSFDSFVSSVQERFRGSSLLATLRCRCLSMQCVRACVRACMHMSCDLSAGVVGVEERRSRAEKIKRKCGKG